MAVIHRRPNFFETAEGLEIEDILRAMEADATYNTTSSYTPDIVRYPDNVLSFLDKHKNYIVANASLDPFAYVANLRLKTRLR